MRVKKTQLTDTMTIQTGSQIKKVFGNYMPLCTAAAVIALVMNHFCRTSDSDALTWILTPTTRWVSVLSGISFEYLPHHGYVNHFHQFLIAAPCAGSRFMLLTFLMLVFSFPAADFLDGKSRVEFLRNYEEMDSAEQRKGVGTTVVRREYLWFGFSMIFSYISTIFVNGIRITASIYLPAILERKGFMDGWLTPDRLHTLIGTVTYFTFLCVIYLLAAAIRRCVFVQVEQQVKYGTDRQAKQESNRQIKDRDSGRIMHYFTGRMRMLVPAFWYLLIVLVLPFMKRMYHNEWDGFGQYTLVVVGVCVSVCMIIGIVGKVGRSD